MTWSVHRPVTTSDLAWLGTGRYVAIWSVRGPVTTLWPGPCVDRSQRCELVRAWTGRIVATWSVWSGRNVANWSVWTGRNVSTWFVLGSVAMCRNDATVHAQTRSQRCDLVCARFGRYVLIGLDTCLMFADNWCLVARLKLFKNFIVKIFPQRFLYENYFSEKCFYPFLRISIFIFILLFLFYIILAKAVILWVIHLWCFNVFKLKNI